MVALFLLAGCLGYSNSAVNPILYAFLSDNFKKSFMKACVCAERLEVNKALAGDLSLVMRRGGNNSSDAGGHLEGRDETNKNAEQIKDETNRPGHRSPTQADVELISCYVKSISSPAQLAHQDTFVINASDEDDGNSISVLQTNIAANNGRLLLYLK